MKRGLLFCLVLSVLCPVVTHAESPIDDVIAGLSAVSDPTLRDWRFQPSDVSGAESVHFDDSEWRIASPEFEWGHQPVCWLRKTVVIPEKVGGIPVAGSKVTLRLGIDDDGECYVNGELRQKFHWGDCNVTLTESARPGDEYVIVVKGVNAGGPGRLLFANLEYSALDDLREHSSKLVEDLRAAKTLVELETDPRKQEECRKALYDTLDIIDMDALAHGDKAAVLASMPAAREALEPVRRLIKEYAVHLIGHAHIDMNWLWLWPETVEVCKNTFSTMFKIMDEYPDFRFSQSQAATYLAMEEQYPEIFNEIRTRVRSGQWEITGGTWVEGDMNMASGEAIVRQVLYAKRYVAEKFGVEPQICWEPDTFGHAWTVPQILAKSGIKYYYFCRCGRNEPVFWWEAPDGSRVLAYNRGWYSERIGEGIGDAPRDLAKRYGVKDGMVVYGVGDHGGGPTREDLNRAIELQKREVYPQVKLDTTTGFFESLVAQKKDFPVVRDELNFEFRGCYTSHSDIKKMNRVMESLLPTAEAFSALATRYGHKYPAADFVTAWRSTCFNQFHDIFDGTAIHGSYEYSRGLFDKASGIGKSALSGSLRVIADKVDTRGHGMPVAVFNPLSWKRTDVVRLPCPSKLKGQLVNVRDGKGSAMYAAPVGGEIVFTAKNVPALGYKIFYITGGPWAIGPSLFDTVIENKSLRVRVDPGSGTITSIFDKVAGREVLPPGAKAGLLQLLFESPRGMSAWNIGRITRTESLESAESVERVSYGVIRVKYKYGKSSFTQDIMLHAGMPRIDIKLTADWYEQGTGDTEGPMLKVAFPVNVNDVKDVQPVGAGVELLPQRVGAVYDIPFGSIERPADGDEVPALKWIDLSGKEYGVSLLNDCKYGHDVSGNTMRLTLLRCSYDPDPTPDHGRQVMTYSLYPHSGDWRAADTPRRGFDLNNPLIPVWTDRHRGSLPEERSFVKVEPSNLIVTALKQAEGSDDLILRFYECKGEAGMAAIDLGMPVKSVRETDLAERPFGKPIAIKNGRIKLPFGKWEIKTLRLSL